MGGGGVSPDTFTANWLHVEGGGGGEVSLDTFTGKGCIVGGGGTSELLTTAAFCSIHHHECFCFQFSSSSP